MTFAALGNHLWQSTLFAGVAALATLALRRNSAAARHAIWLAASVKFLVPFAALIALGAQVGPRLPVTEIRTETILVFDGPADRLAPLPPPVASNAAARTVALPSPAIVGAMWLCGSVGVLGFWWTRWRRVAAIARTATMVECGREFDALRRLERSTGISRPIRLVESTAMLEPGVFGLFRPVLVWPRAIGDRLDQEQVVTILAHEVSHVRRRDNLTAMVHMLVEAVFWFHPLVWWIGARLVDERERACDEAVLRTGSEPRVYAETILTACRTYLESPLPCVSGVTGSNLTRRIERIMSSRSVDALTAWKKLLVAVVPAAALVAPIAVGILDAPRLRAASLSSAIRAHQAESPSDRALSQFEVASVKQNKSSVAKVMIQTQPGGRFTAYNVTLRALIVFAYKLQPLQLSGGPDWLDSDRFDVLAKADDDSGDLFDADRRGEVSRPQLMLRALLTERFKLDVHTETRELPIYALVRARNDGKLGPELRPSTLDCGPAADPGGRPADPSSGRVSCGIRIARGPGTMVAGGASIAQLASTFVPSVGPIVSHPTGLTGNYDFTLSWTPDQIPQGFSQKIAAGGLASPDPNGPSIFTAIQEQLGLKLDSQKGPVDILVVDRAEHPREN
jgi:bla regulator protein BlaR1